MRSLPLTSFKDCTLSFSTSSAFFSSSPLAIVNSLVAVDPGDDGLTGFFCNRYIVGNWGKSWGMHLYFSSVSFFFVLLVVFESRLAVKCLLQINVSSGTFQSPPLGKLDFHSAGNLCIDIPSLLSLLYPNSEHNTFYPLSTKFDIVLNSISV